MKILKILGHPVLLLSIGALVMIEGDKFGGFYLLYLIFGLMYGAPFALVYLASIGLVLAGYKLNPGLSRITINFLAFVLFIASYALFFTDGKSNNKETFESTVPLLSFYVLGFLCLCFLINSVVEIGRHTNQKSDKVMSL